MQHAKTVTMAFTSPPRRSQISNGNPWILDTATGMTMNVKVGKCDSSWDGIRSVTCPRPRGRHTFCGLCVVQIDVGDGGDELPESALAPNPISQNLPSVPARWVTARESNHAAPDKTQYRTKHREIAYRIGVIGNCIMGARKLLVKKGTW